MNKEDLHNLKELRDSIQNANHKKSLRKAMNYIYALESRINTVKVLSRTLMNEIHHPMGSASHSEDRGGNEGANSDDPDIQTVSFEQNNAITQNPFQNIKNILMNEDPISGYRKIKEAALYAVNNLGKDWINPVTDNDVHLKEKLENLVRSSAPEKYSDNYQFWYKFLNYSKSFE